MKNTRELGRVPKSQRLQGQRHQAPSAFSGIPEYGRFSKQAIDEVARSRQTRSTAFRALVAACSLSLLLFSCIGTVEGLQAGTLRLPPLQLLRQRLLLRSRRYPRCRQRQHLLSKWQHSRPARSRGVVTCRHPSQHSLHPPPRVPFGKHPPINKRATPLFHLS